MTRRIARAAVAVLAAGVAALPVVALAATDPYRPDQYALDRIGAPAAWTVARGEGIVIAIVDSGVDLAHPDLVDRFVRDEAGRIVGRDYIDDDAVPQDENGHGTMVAGIAAAATDNGVGIAAVAPAARILPLRVLDAEGDGRGSDVDAAIRWAVDNGADVINLSLESVDRLPGRLITQAPAAAVRYAWENGVVVVAAAGNSGSAFTDYPDSSPVLLVGATDRDDVRAAFSDTGRRDAVLAPGVEIISTWCRPVATTCDPEIRYGQASGTSFSAPHVAGAVAVVLSTGRGAAEAVEDLRETAEDLGTPGPDPQHGYGRIDLARAVGADGTTRPAPTPSASPSPATPPTGGPGTAPPPPPPPPPPAPPPPPPAPTTTESGTPVAPPPSPSPSSIPAPGSSITPLGPPTVAATGPRAVRRSVVATAVIAVLASAAAWGVVWNRERQRR